MHHLGENQNNLQPRENWLSENESSWCSPFSASALLAEFLTSRHGWNPATPTLVSPAQAESLPPSLPRPRLSSLALPSGEQHKARLWMAQDSPQARQGCAFQLVTARLTQVLKYVALLIGTPPQGGTWSGMGKMPMCKEWFCCSSQIITAFFNKPHCRPFWERDQFLVPNISFFFPWRLFLGVFCCCWFWVFLISIDISQSQYCPIKVI